MPTQGRENRAKAPAVTQHDANETPQEIVDFLDANRETIKALFMLPTERNAPVFAALATWISDEPHERGPVRLSGLRAFVDALDEALQLRLPVSLTPLPLPAVYARLQAAAQIHEITFGVREGDGMRDLIGARCGPPGIWTITHTPTGSVVGHIGPDARFRIDDPRPDDIHRQAIIQTAIFELQAIQRIETLIQSDPDPEADTKSGIEPQTLS
ncbi:MAG: hypothetical protein ACOYB0_08380 [Polynucleobacter sp.]